VNAPLRDVQVLADQILELLGVRIRNGELVIRYGDALVQKLETRTVHHPLPAAAAGPCARGSSASGARMNEPTRASLQQLIRETRLALKTPIDFADLERRGVLERAKGGWYVLLKPQALPAHAWQQVRGGLIDYSSMEKEYDSISLLPRTVHVERRVIVDASREFAERRDVQRVEAVLTESLRTLVAVVESTAQKSGGASSRTRSWRISALSRGCSPLGSGSAG
jgi:hypothetical protein